GAQLRDALGEEGAIDGDDLRRVGHGLLRKIRRLGGQQYVARCPRPGEIARQGHTDHRGDPASVQGFALYDQHRPSKARGRARGRGQIRPPDLALRDLYHSLRSRTRRAAALTKASDGSVNWSTAWFMASVTSSGAWRDRYSARASA